MWKSAKKFFFLSYSKQFYSKQHRNLNNITQTIPKPAIHFFYALSLSFSLTSSFFPVLTNTVEGENITGSKFKRIESLYFTEPPLTTKN